MEKGRAPVLRKRIRLWEESSISQVAATRGRQGRSSVHSGDEVVASRRTTFFRDSHLGRRSDMEQEAFIAGRRQGPHANWCATPAWLRLSSGEDSVGEVVVSSP